MFAAGKPVRPLDPYPLSFRAPLAASSDYICASANWTAAAASLPFSKAYRHFRSASGPDRSVVC